MAKLVDVGSIASYFESLSDPRHTRNRKHLLVDIIVVSVCAILCGCDGPTAMHRWAKERHQWLTQHLALPNGVPSRDCLRRLLLALQPQAFQRCFQTWIADALASAGGEPELAPRRGQRPSRRRQRQIHQELDQPADLVGAGDQVRRRSDLVRRVLNVFPSIYFRSVK